MVALHYFCLMPKCCLFQESFFLSLSAGYIMLWKCASFFSQSIHLGGVLEDFNKSIHLRKVTRGCDNFQYFQKGEIFHQVKIDHYNWIFVGNIWISNKCLFQWNWQAINRKTSACVLLVINMGQRWKYKFSYIRHEHVWRILRGPAPNKRPMISG